MKLAKDNLILSFLMIAASVLAWNLTPTQKISEKGTKVNLDRMIPRTFSNWKELPDISSQVINPEQKDLIDRLYSQTLSRSYVNQNGFVIMLSIAYGLNQTDSLALHYPEVCYPAQGFQLLSKKKDILDTDFGQLRLTRLMTSLGNRSEPITYWVILGDKAVQGGVETKLTQLTYGFQGQIPDGLLFRVSSISSDAQHGYDLQSKFIKDLLSSLPGVTRKKLAGVSL